MRSENREQTLRHYDVKCRKEEIHMSCTSGVQRSLTYQDVFGKKKKTEEMQNLSLEKLHEFPGHPFQVQDDAEMEELMQSIHDKGVLNPIIVRSKDDDEYEILSGHRRTHACRRLGLLYIPATVRELSDEDAVDLMVYSNLHRGKILPSEKAHAYQMQLDILRHQGKRGEATPEAIGRKYGESASKVLRYARLTNLNNDLLRMVDEGVLGIQAGYTLSYLKDIEQRWVAAYGSKRKFPKGKWPSKLRNLSEEGLLTEEKVALEITGKQRHRQSVVLRSDQLEEYFPDEWSVEDMEHTILMLLSTWKDSQELKNRKEG